MFQIKFCAKQRSKWTTIWFLLLDSNRVAQRLQMAATPASESLETISGMILKF